MYKKKLYIVLITYLIFNAADAKKFRRSKRPKAEEDSTPQPNVVTYSTFGFNDVGSYDGFVPSSPDYVNYLSNFNQDASQRLYAPAFPTAQDNYPSPSQSSQTFSFSDDAKASIHQYHPSPSGFASGPGQEQDARTQNNVPEMYGRNAGEDSAPIYGTKLSSKHRGKQFSQFNNTDYNVFGSASSPSENKYSFHEVHSSFENRPATFGEQPSKNYQYNFNYATTHPAMENDDDFVNPPTEDTRSTLKFPKVIDFTKYKQFFSADLPTTTTKSPSYSYKPSPNSQNENSFLKGFEELSTTFPSSFKDSFAGNKEIADITEKEPPKQLSFPGVGFSQNNLNYVNNDNKYSPDHKDKFKYNQWSSTNYTNDFKNWKNPIKGYQYATNFSNMNFEFDFSGGKKPVNNSNDEVVPASSNIELASYQFPENDYSLFKKLPGFKGQENEDYVNAIEVFKAQQRYKYDPKDYLKSLYSTVPTTTTLWGSSYKNADISSYKHFGKKPIFEEDIGDNIVHIPKRPYSSKYGYGGKPAEWSSQISHRPHKSKKPSSHWNKEVSTRFKSEEDLLGLRTRDTSHPSYLPTYEPEASLFSSDYDYKKLVEKWRQSYLRAKYRDVGLRDYEGYSSEPKPIHVPVPKPYAIEVPHPVIVPVPQPYPVRVPVPRPVAVPVVRELTVPVEKPVPYPVYKTVPFPVEKLMPYPVEKEVQVPVMKPYAVPVPHIRPVFHHTRPRDETDGAIDEDDDYLPRPATKKLPYVKKPRSTRNRAQRPPRAHPERTRRRWPTRHPGPPHRRPELPVSYKHYEHELDDFEHTHSEYIQHCKRTGNC